MIAHVAGMPVEEMLPSVSGAGAVLVLARVSLLFHLRRQEPARGRPGSSRP